ncbi:MAG TPA: DUF1579 family protein [Planctomycetota bacterium]|nr:DUF1579 family protein [Planctomycetota bacterium]
MQVFAFAAVSLAALAFGVLWTQDPKPKRFTHPTSKDADGGMARWMQIMQPSDAHARLHELIGSYDVTMKMQMMPGQPAMETKGTAEIGWFTEGKWLQETWSIEMMGQGVEGIAHLGYDNFKERFVWCKVDSMQTSLQTASGLFDASGDNLILWGTIDEPMTPEQDKQVKYVYRGFGKDRFTLEVHDMMIGEKDTKVLEFVYTRKKE